MKTKKVVTKSTCGVRVPATKAKMVCSKKIEAKKSDKKGACDINGTCAKRCSTKLAAPTKKPAAKKTPAKKKQEVVRAVTENPDRIAQICGQSERRAQRVELADVKDATISVEALKIGLLLAAIDGHCDKDEIAKFKAVAKSCGGLSSAKIELIVKQMQRRISSLEEVVRNGASEDEVVNNFVSEASNMGVVRFSRIGFP